MLTRHPMWNLLPPTYWQVDTLVLSSNRRTSPETPGGGQSGTVQISICDLKKGLRTDVEGQRPTGSGSGSGFGSGFGYGFEAPVLEHQRRQPHTSLQLMAELLFRYRSGGRAG
ncbi:hypothetical protein E4U42_003906 [Claviceps africana]|uniref:Uncharacterized protein n=1 Tax=Claviceps africana TaxID=83212 RepID=A0A8K0J635_9HYPO|nr:hypothetical protein E4U42_003906 [Claviceps africana]